MRALSFFLRPAAVCLALVLVVGGWASAAEAANCDGNVSNLVFGDVDLLDGDAVSAAATLTFGCSAQPGDQVLICVGMGANPAAPGMGSMVPRYLKANSGQVGDLAFNLYRDPAHNEIWGDFGSAGYPPKAYVMQFGAGQYYLKQTSTVYGQIKSQGQTSLPSGLYNTTAIGNWPVHMRVKTFTGATPPACSTGGMSEQSSNFYIAATVKKDCRIDAVSDLDFGTVFQTLDQNIDSTATLTVTCTSDAWANYQVSLGDGRHANGTQRRMQGPGGGFLDYGLFTDAARTEPWPANGVTQTGSGQQQLRVYGRVPPQTVPAPGVYSDTVVVTVSY